MGYNIFAPLALKAWNDVLVHSELRTVVELQRSENTVAHSVGPVGPNYGEKSVIKSSPERAL
jgi:hypothetical protein